jgi:uncharacterized protein (UPF0335 family)
MTNPRKPKPKAEAEATPLDVIGGNARTQLLAIVERVERVQEELSVARDDLKEIFAEAKGAGFDTKILRKVIRLRQMDQAKRQEEEALVDLYESAIAGTEQPFERDVQPGDILDEDTGV